MTPQSMRELVICRASDADVLQLARCDFSFEVTAELEEPFDDMRSVPVKPPYLKNYGFDADELVEHMNNSAGALFVARADNCLVGYLAVSQSWNEYAVIDDIAVDVPYRGSGVSRLLMDAAVDWARNVPSAGVRLETQSVNLAACRFYRRYGFQLGGYDRYLYRGLHPGSREVALFWYLSF